MALKSDRLTITEVHDRNGTTGQVTRHSQLHAGGPGLGLEPKWSILLGLRQWIWQEQRGFLWQAQSSKPEPEQGRMRVLHIIFPPSGSVRPSGPALQGLYIVGNCRRRFLMSQLAGEDALRRRESMQINKSLLASGAKQILETYTSLWQRDTIL